MVLSLLCTFPFPKKVLSGKSGCFFARFYNLTTARLWKDPVLLCTALELSASKYSSTVKLPTITPTFNSSAGTIPTPSCYQCRGCNPKGKRKPLCKYKWTKLMKHYFSFPEAAVLAESESARNELATALNLTNFLSSCFVVFVFFSIDTELLKKWQDPIAWPFSEITFKDAASGKKVQNKCDVQWIIWQSSEGWGYILTVGFEFVVFRATFSLSDVCLKDLKSGRVSKQMFIISGCRLAHQHLYSGRKAMFLKNT